MVRADLYIFGYIKLTFEPESSARLATILMRLGVSCKLNYDFVFLRISDYERVKKRIEPLILKVGEKRGLISDFKLLFKRRAVAFALSLLLAFQIFFSGVVWRCAVTTDGLVSEESVIEQLRRQGFGVGTRWADINVSDVENALLFESNDVSWISINRHGTVAYVEVVSKVSPEVEEKPSGYSNVVAITDCVIEEITVSTGYAAVKVGEAVKAGDLLISGVIPEELGGGYCRAEGEVWGRRCEEYSVSVSKTEDKKVESMRYVSELSLQFFDFSLNIFKKYGNVSTEYDIIKEIEELIVFGRYKLPVSLTKTYTVSYGTRTLSYDEEQLVNIAFSRLNSLMRARLCSSDVVSIKNDGEFTDTGYTATARLTLIQNVGKIQEFEVRE